MKLNSSQKADVAARLKTLYGAVEDYLWIDKEDLIFCGTKTNPYYKIKHLYKKLGDPYSLRALAEQIAEIQELERLIK